MCLIISFYSISFDSIPACCTRHKMEQNSTGPRPFQTFCCYFRYHSWFVFGIVDPLHVRLMGDNRCLWKCCASISVQINAVAYFIGYRFTGYTKVSDYCWLFARFNGTRFVRWTSSDLCCDHVLYYTFENV